MSDLIPPSLQGSSQGVSLERIAQKWQDTSDKNSPEAQDLCLTYIENVCQARFQESAVATLGPPLLVRGADHRDDSNSTDASEPDIIVGVMLHPDFTQAGASNADSRSDSGEPSSESQPRCATEAFATSVFDELSWIQNQLSTYKN